MVLRATSHGEIVRVVARRDGRSRFMGPASAASVHPRRGDLEEPASSAWGVYFCGASKMDLEELGLRLCPLPPASAASAR
ncbi:hypothetical protein CLOP_g3064 [Closterium sp. NIES-67]|nr:hypothetical protein CLOP_g3064 [Closterium sp. NIES-67]